MYEPRPLPLQARTMNGYMDQKRGQSGRSRLSRASGRAAVQSVPPSAAESNGRLGRHTPQRVSVQPPVCGVQPGKVLELRTTLGLMRARALLDQQLEMERQLAEEEKLRGGGGEDRRLTTSGRLKHGRLQPLGRVSDPSMVSNSCLGIVSVSGQSSGQRSRSRSCTTPGVPLDNPRSTGHNDIIARKGVKLRERSRSATMPNNMPVDLLKELTANLSVTQQTALLPEEESMTTASTGGTDSIKTSGNDNNQMRADTPQHNTSPHTDRAQNLSSPKETDCEMQTSEVPVGQIRVLPPVIRQGQLAMKVEVRRLKATKGANASDLNQKTHPSVDAREQNIEANGKVEKGLPHVLSAMERHSPKPLAVKSESKEGNNGQQRPITHQDVSSRSSPSSPVKVSIVSLGEAPTVRPRSQLQRRRKRRHSEGRPPGSGRLSQGWSPPQAIEPLVGSPLHTPRKWSQDKGRRDLANESNEKEFEARRSLMTSPGLMINVDVNEFLKDTEADDPA